MDRGVPSWAGNPVARFAALAASLLSTLWLLHELATGSYAGALAAWIVLSFSVTAAWSSRTITLESPSAPRPPGRIARAIARVDARWLGQPNKQRIKRLAVYAGPPVLAAMVSVVYLVFGRLQDPDIPVPLLLSLIALAAAYGGLLAGAITAFIVTFGFATVAQPSSGLISIGMASCVIAIAVGSLWGNASRAYASLRTANERLRRVAYRDPLTGLLDRRGFETVLRTEVARHARRGSQLTVLLLQIDEAELRERGVRRAISDSVLQAFADSLEQQVRGSDTSARTDAYEFAVCLTDSLPSAAEQVRSRVEDAFRRELGDYVAGVATPTVRSASALFPDDGKTVDDLLRAVEGKIDSLN